MRINLKRCIQCLQRFVVVVVGVFNVGGEITVLYSKTIWSKQLDDWQFYDPLFLLPINAFHLNGLEYFFICVNFEYFYNWENFDDWNIFLIADQVVPIGCSSCHRPSCRYKLTFYHQVDKNQAHHRHLRRKQHSDPFNFRPPSLLHRAPPSTPCATQKVGYCISLQMLCKIKY